LNRLPFDLLKAGRQLTFALHKLFPKLNYRLIAGLDRAYLDAVDEAYQKRDGDQLTERETKDFVLMECFGIVLKLMKKPVDLLKMLLSLHSRKVLPRGFLVEHLLESLNKDDTFESGERSQINSGMDLTKPAPIGFVAGELLSFRSIPREATGYPCLHARFAELGCRSHRIVQPSVFESGPRPDRGPEHPPERGRFPCGGFR